MRKDRESGAVSVRRKAPRLVFIRRAPAVRGAARAGFTMAEALMVMGIVVVLAAAAIPGGMGAWNNVKQLQLNRSAETIYMTAQRNLIAAKVSGASLTAGEVTSKDTSTANKDIVLPANTISPALYAGNWVIMYNGDWTVTMAYYSETEEFDANAASVTEWMGKAASETGKVGRYGG